MYVERYFCNENMVIIFKRHKQIFTLNVANFYFCLLNINIDVLVSNNHPTTNTKPL